MAITILIFVFVYNIKNILTAKLKTRAERRYKELKKINKNIKYKEVFKSIQIRDQRDYKRKISPLKITKDSIVIDTTNLTTFFDS